MTALEQQKIERATVLMIEMDKVQTQMQKLRLELLDLLCELKFKPYEPKSPVKLVRIK